MSHICPASLASWPSRQMHIRSALCRYENLVQIRCLVDGVDTDSILQDWHTILPEYMDKWALDRSQVSCWYPLDNLCRDHDHACFLQQARSLCIVDPNIAAVGAAMRPIPPVET